MTWKERAVLFLLGVLVTCGLIILSAINHVPVCKRELVKGSMEWLACGTPH